MSFLWSSIAAFHLVSLLFMVIAVSRLYKYTRRYKLKENRHTLLFGVISVDHIVLFYIATVGLYTVGSVLLVNFIVNK
jgi:hypothetical protein